MKLADIVFNSHVIDTCHAPCYIFIHVRWSLTEPKNYALRFNEKDQKMYITESVS